MEQGKAEGEDEEFRKGNELPHPHLLPPQPFAQHARRYTLGSFRFSFLLASSPPRLYRSPLPNPNFLLAVRPPLLTQLPCLFAPRFGSLNLNSSAPFLITIASLYRSLYSSPTSHSSSVTMPPPLCLKTPLLPSLHGLSVFRVEYRALGHSRKECHNSRSFKSRAKFRSTDDRLGLRVESVAFAPLASPGRTSAGSPTHSDTFLSVRTEKELLLGIQKEVELKRIPPRAGYAMGELYRNYKDAVLVGGASEDKIVEIMATVLDCVLLQFEEPFTFPSYHKAMREPYDYYTFGQNYIRCLVDFRNSYVGNASQFEDIERQLKQGDNVVLLANHQTEADPAVMALLLESIHPYIAQNLTYIAGDRVVTDPFCKPFSMGRNLLCVYSKKHINDEPELVDMKRKANARSLKELALLLRKGGQLIWIAPSGGRDRPDPTTFEWKPALFDTSPVENIRRLIEHSKAPGHMYPLALLCYNIMPPPTTVEKEIGERRLLGYSGVGMSVGAELHFKDITEGCVSSDEAAECFAQTAWRCVNEQYGVLSCAVENGEGKAASTNLVALSQPWSASLPALNEDPKVPCHSL